MIAGIELGGTKCIALLAESPDAIVEQVKVDTTNPETTLNALDRQLEIWSKSHGFDSIGIASFGPLELDRSKANYGSIVSTTKPGWSGTPITARYERFGVPIAIDTDVVGAAHAEQRWGAAQGLSNVAYVTVGTGVGVGALIDGRAIFGRGNAEMGHMRVKRMDGDEWPGACVFHGDCVEGLASGFAIAQRHGPGAIADDWAGWTTVEHALAMLVHNLMVTLQPHRILIGGGVGFGRRGLVDAVRSRALESLANYHTARDIEPDFLMPAALGASAGPLGALALGLSAVGR